MKKILSFLLLLIVLISTLPAWGQTTAPVTNSITTPGNRLVARTNRLVTRVVVLVDATWSFANKLPDASHLSWRFINTAAITNANCEVYVIRVGAKRSPVIYIRGVRSRSQAKKEFENAFVGPASGEEGTGTNWVGALAQATKYAQLAPAPTEAHLLVMGDMIADPHKDPVTHRVLEKYVQVEGWDYSPLTTAFSSATFLFVDNNVRLKLAENASLIPINPIIWTASETDAQKASIQPPKKLRQPVAASSTNTGTPWGLIGIVLAGVYFAMRSPKAKQSNGGQRT